MGQSTPTATIALFKKQFFRDFTYGSGPTTVMDQDIQNALNSADGMFNPSLFDTSLLGVSPNQTSESLIAYLNATAHYLVTAIQAVGGLAPRAGSPGMSSQGEGVITGKGGAGLSINYSFPTFIADSPALFQFTKTTYGLAYLQALAPKLVGNVGAVAGETSESSDFPAGS